MAARSRLRPNRYRGRVGHFDTLLVGTEVGVLVDRNLGNDGSGLES